MAGVEVQKKIRFDDEKKNQGCMIILGGKIHTKKPSFLKATSFQFEAALHTLL